MWRMPCAKCWNLPRTRNNTTFALNLPEIDKIFVAKRGKW